jgi:hypothetical protein
VRTLRKAVLGVAVAGVAAAGAAVSASAATLLRLDGIGPLHLGMSRADAVATGWLAHRMPGCELAGPLRPVVYRFAGPRAPARLHGDAELDRGRLRVLSFSHGVRTAVGVVVRHTTTTDMVARYRRAGFRASARYDSTFQGTFVTVRRRHGGRQVIGAFAEHSVITTLAVPGVPVCE